MFAKKYYEEIAEKLVTMEKLKDEFEKNSERLRYYPILSGAVPVTKIEQEATLTVLRLYVAYEKPSYFHY